jgi:hypothetical protein
MAVGRMGSMVTTSRVSLDDFLAIHGIAERRLELIDGEVYEKPMQRWGHGELAMEIGFRLRPARLAVARPSPGRLSRDGATVGLARRSPAWRSTSSRRHRHSTG